MGAARDHCFVMVQHADEGSDLLYIARQGNLKDCIENETQVFSLQCTEA
jgi:hypothetical protein